MTWACFLWCYGLERYRDPSGEPSRGLERFRPEIAEDGDLNSGLEVDVLGESDADSGDDRHDVAAGRERVLALKLVGLGVEPRELRHDVEAVGYRDDGAEIQLERLARPVIESVLAARDPDAESGESASSLDGLGPDVDGMRRPISVSRYPDGALKTERASCPESEVGREAFHERCSEDDDDRGGSR